MTRNQQPGPGWPRRWLHRLRRWTRGGLRRSGTVNKQPLNKASLLVIVLIDLFLLANIFHGLNAISDWPLTPQQIYSCQAERTFQILGPGGLAEDPGAPGFRQSALAAQADHPGSVNPICLTYAGLQDRIREQVPLRARFVSVDRQQQAIAALEQTNATIRRQYDSTLLEEIAGQPRQRSINAVRAAAVRATIESNDSRIAGLNAEITAGRERIAAAPESSAFLTFLADDSAFERVNRGYERASFWAPSIRLLFQTMFLLPVVLGSLAVHRHAQRRGHGLSALISWHLLVIALVPLLLKLFEFAQVGVLFELLAAMVRRLFGNLLFLVSYLYILVIPLAGFGLIRLLQGVVFNSRVQAAGRAQNSRCPNCARRPATADAAVAGLRTLPTAHPAAPAVLQTVRHRPAIGADPVNRVPPRAPAGRISTPFWCSTPAVPASRPRCWPQTACFDTAFHSTLPPEARTYAIPGDWRWQGAPGSSDFAGLKSATYPETP